MRIEHTKGPFRVVKRETCEDGSVMCARVDSDNSYLCFLEGTTKAWKETPDICLTDGELIAMCDSAPHECTVPNCPGNINRQKLEMWDEMLAALEELKSARRADPYRIAGMHPASGHPLNALGVARANADILIAKAKELK